MSQELEYKVSIKTDKVEASDLISPAAIQSLVELNREIDQYRQELAELKKAEKEQGTLTDEQAVKQESLKGKIKETSTEYQRQQRELLKMQTATKAVGGSYNDLVKQNAALSAAMRALPLGENTAELQKLQAQYNANNERLKEFDKSMGNHQRNVGNYSSALDNLGGMMSSIPGPIGDIVKTFEQLNKVLKAANVSTAANATAQQSQAASATTATVATGNLTIAQRLLNTVMKANPVLLLVAAFAALVSMLSTLQPVMNNIERLTTILSTSFNYARDTIYLFINGLADTRESLRDTIRIVDQAKVSLQQLADSEGDFVAQQAKDRTYVAKRLKDARDITKSYKERIESIELAITRDKESANEAKDRSKIEIAANEAILNSTESLATEKLAAGQLLAQMYARQEQSENRQRELSEQLNTISREQAAKDKAIVDESIRNEQKLAQEQQKLREQKAARDKQVNEAKLADFYALQEEIRIAEQQSLDDLPELDLGISDREKAQLDRAYNLGEELADQTIQQAITTGDKLKALELKQAEELRQRRLFYLSQKFTDEEATQMAINDMSVRHTKELQDKTVEIEKDSAKTREDIALNVASNAISIGTSLFGKSKALSVAQAIIDTYAAANNAAKNTEGGVVVKAIAAAAVIAAGLANVKKILSTKLGSGSMGAGSTATVGASTANIGATQAAVLTPRASANELGTLSRMEGSKERFSGRVEPRITVTANVDRRGLAIAVRDGERSIRTQQYDFK